MKRNNKGFTLVELLAAVAILAILTIITIPIVVRLFDSSRNKMYISDAKKLISLAEYKLNASSSDIEKPDEGDAIIITMNYLDSSDFDNPPGNGQYERDKSYVVIKNNGGNLEYSVTTVERLKKGGYRGVDLVRKAILYTNAAVNHVVSFEAAELVSIESNIDKGYKGSINDKLGRNYIDTDNKISAVYNYPDLVDNSSTVGVYGVPRIVSASLISSSSKGFNSLDVLLQLKAEDKDTPRSDLKVYLNIDSGYEAALASEGVSYGDSETFTTTINLKDYGKKYDGNGANIYVVVEDPDGHATKKTITYKVHKNEPPEIDSSSKVTRRDQDVYHGIPLNMLTAKVTLIVSDDIDENSQLSVCFKESSVDEDFATCDDYKNYYDVFSTENTAEYLFHECDGGRCRRDGSTHYLTAFVKDTYGETTKMKFSYTFSINKRPELKSFTLRSKEETFTTTGSKKIYLNVEATDDVDRDDQMTVFIEDGYGYAPMNYGFQPIEYNITGLYDGSTRTIKVTIIDSEDAYSDTQTAEHTLYLNKPPKIKSYSIESDGAACINSALCPPEEGGNKRVRVSLDAEDDISRDDLMVCLAVGDDYCYNYSSFRRYNNQTPTYTIPSDYDGQTKDVHIYIFDTEGAIDTAVLPYKLYTNQPPVLDFAVFVSRTDGRPVSNSLNTIFTINAEDDVDTSATLRFQVIEDGVITLNNARLSDYIGKNNEFRLAGTHDGKQRNIQVRVFDNDSGSDFKSMTYDVYKGLEPTINLFSVRSTEIACLNDKYCPIENNGNYKVKYLVKVSDDIDDDKDIQICVSEDSSNCTEYSLYTNYLSEGTPKDMDYTFSVSDETKPYDGSNKTLYLYVKDSDNNVVKQSIEYTLYKNKKPVITENPVIVSNADDPDVHLPDITYSIEAEDDIDEELQISYCYRKDNGSDVCTVYMDYQKDKVLDNSFFNNTNPSGENYTIYSVIKDSYGATVKSEELTYKLYTDLTPSIYSGNIGSGKRIYKNVNGDVVNSLEGIENPLDYSAFTRLKINFSVDDPYDKYSICISTNNSTCDNYQGLYIANNCSTNNCTVTRKGYNIYYDKAGFIEEGNHINLYLFVKDSHSKVVVRTLYDDDYHACVDNSEEVSYVYELNTSETNNEAISISRCAGKCYRYDYVSNTNNDIKALYTKKMTYFDKLNTHISCNAESPEEVEYEAYCDFKDCFYSNSNYNRNAIGTKLYVDDNPWTTKVNGNDYICTGHYNLYLSSYDTGDKEIKLDMTTTKICNTALENGEYNYDSSSSNPYVRVSD